MKINPLRFLVLAAIVVAFTSVSRSDEITEKEFRELQEALTPDENELWRTIPWKIALLDAQRTAATQRKPIFIWAMDGHPLGCT